MHNLTEGGRLYLVVDADANIGKYPIGVVARLTDVSEQRLRSFEAAGLIEPERTEGGTRLYSDVDVALIVRIAELADKGVNFAGIREVLEIETRVDDEEGEPGQERTEGTE